MSTQERIQSMLIGAFGGVAATMMVYGFSEPISSAMTPTPKACHETVEDQWKTIIDQLDALQEGIEKAFPSHPAPQNTP
ncbi:MAG: hypothetical protein LRY76_06950 [Alphaproteobacteria bacterium]|nr:hypothetical protein [Alphaproteobacteria bacterium]